ncbi:fimbrial protein [Parabacteroides goldsteinii]|uniref:fimbrial protein n=1 Tax=Parabacteroides goldsteinii TaxID=328812 RepID=UPI00241E8F0B|nr:fimbrial protein [Parabacteroides goldsteinii]
MMKWQNNFFFIFIVCTLFSCSTDNEPVDQVLPIQENASLVLAVKDKGQNSSSTLRVGRTITKSGIKDSDVKSLTVAIFNAGAFDGNGIARDAMVYCITDEATVLDESTAETKEMKVQSGKVDIIVIANVGSAESRLKAAKNENEFLAILTKGLEEETMENGLTMSSIMLEGYEILADKINYFGYRSDGTGQYESGVEIKGDGPVELIRDVASVSLKSVTLSRGENYASKSFTLKEVFVANAKSLSSIASTTRWGEIEKSFSIENETDYQKYWVGQTFTGDQASMDEGFYKSGLQTAKDILLKRTLETEDATLNLGSSWFADAVGTTTVPSPVGHQFYVYENTKGERLATDAVTGKGNYTLLVVKGDYTYTAKGGEEITDADRYYTVIVNDPTMENTKYDDTVGKHSYVKRNCKYEINLTILGPGSELPYDPMISTNLSASVKVEPWNVKNIHEEVE